MSNKASASGNGQRVSPSTAAVMESVQRVQREMDIKNTRNETEERQWALCKTAAEQAVGQIMLRQGLIVQREDGVPFDLGLASGNQIATGQFPLQFQSQNASAPTATGIHTQEPTMYSNNTGLEINRPLRPAHGRDCRGISCSTILAILEVCIIFLFGLFVNYDNEVTAKPSPHKPSYYERQKHEEDSSRLHKFYPCKSDSESAAPAGQTNFFNPITLVFRFSLKKPDD